MTVAGALLVASVAASTVTTGGVTAPGLANLGTLSDNNSEVINTDTSGGTVAVIGATVAATLIAGGGSNTAYINRSASGSVLLTGGNSYIGNSGTASTVNTTLTGGQSLGDGRAYIDATVGSANVTIGNNGLINVNTGANSNAKVVAQAGTVVVAVSAPTSAGGSATVPAVTVSGATVAGSQLIYIPNGGNAFINPNASDVIVLSGMGRETLAGGSGSVTLFGGIGDFTGGSAGGNIMLTSTVTSSVAGGGTTLRGAGLSDTLYAQSGNNVLIATTGNEVLAGGASATVGNLFVTGGVGSSTTVIGGTSGGNTVSLGSGSALVYGQHSSPLIVTVAATLMTALSIPSDFGPVAVPAGTSTISGHISVFVNLNSIATVSAPAAGTISSIGRAGTFTVSENVLASTVQGNTYTPYGVAGSDTIGDFVPGVDTLRIANSYGTVSEVFDFGQSNGGATQINDMLTLGDGTKITLLNVGPNAGFAAVVRF